MCLGELYLRWNVFTDVADSLSFSLILFLFFSLLLGVWRLDGGALGGCVCWDDRSMYVGCGVIMRGGGCWMLGAWMRACVAGGFQSAGC